MAFVLSLFLLYHLFFFLCLRKAELHDCGISQVSSNTFLIRVKLQPQYSFVVEFAMRPLALFYLCMSKKKKKKKKNNNKKNKTKKTPKKTSQHDILSLTLSVPNFRRHLSSAFFYFNKLLLEKTFICKVERLNVKQSRSR